MRMHECGCLLNCARLEGVQEGPSKSLTFSTFDHICSKPTRQRDHINEPKSLLNGYLGADLKKKV